MIDPICPYPEHHGEEWTEVIEIDRKYVEWMVSGEGPESLNDKLYEYLMDLLEES